ncbi:MAG: RES domain-containing protein [Candidatus Eremiobacteraeota bacterium]|nr:RES domain-containing protein [Candidatus Eremiobacteraeota bacterium]
MNLYRAFPYDPRAAATEKGGALYVPSTNAGRIANPDLYHELYLAAVPEAAIAETFGRLPVWKAEDFVHANGNRFGLARYAIRDVRSILNLDDVETLRELQIAKPTDIVTRNRAKTCAWARRIFEMHRYAGTCWWSSYNADWMIFGIWRTGELSFEPAVEILNPRHPAVEAAAAEIKRQIA